ncbi:DUF6515 family protein [Gloeocapsa sp. PCC 73106]|uniref:DUF6515 family protein n=1 Tax=Gloeocapsa sp. PCC 73106 TaxID=102232 RepID=UPI0002AB9C65|nr:DUF6515 family protein [Gloeocapsa sp. PCC 73106]ELR98569.1 hypothetical protein GLO73106DRAFT_00024030 [Gloeocapsa sp. PCC 73106]
MKLRGLRFITVFYIVTFGIVPIVVQEALAVIGRPATPVSVAGSARRTSRRVIRRSAVYVSTLPAGCSTVIIEGSQLYQCAGTYYQPDGAQYVVVYVD